MEADAMGEGRRGWLRRPCFGALVLALSIGVGLVPASASHAPSRSDPARSGQEVVDLALHLSVSRSSVPYGGSIREVIRVTNSGTVTSKRGIVFGQEINRPGQPHYPGKAVYASVRSRRGHCLKGTYGPSSKLQTFSCLTRRIAPGKTQRVVIKIKHIKSSLLLDAGGFYGSRSRDDVRRNDEAQKVIRIRRR